uniref:very short patch repair endonuclease n=1 Tax=Cupriavidus taiwanensis TaxID=164546 RepID=UPI000E2EC5F5
MSAIKSKDTKPEMTVRQGLFARGLRYRLHMSGLPGRPDIVFPRFRAVIFVHGCFWHGHEGCRLFRLPSSNRGYWQAKIERNRDSGLSAEAKLRELGWRVRVVWECDFHGQPQEVRAGKLDDLANWVRSTGGSASSSGLIQPTAKQTETARVQRRPPA